MIPHRPNIPLGLCQCGCGEKTPIANQTRKSIGWVEGLPIRFIMGDEIVSRVLIFLKQSHLR